MTAYSTASSIAYSIADLREQARSRLPRAIFDFFDGGAEDEVTLQENLAAFRRARLVPRVLRGVANVSTEATLFDRPMALPIAVAPTGAVGYGRPGADLAIARAACAAGIPYTLSTTATASIEQIAKGASGRLWFQAYVLSNKTFLMALIERARQADYEALMITVDLPVGGKRERDFRNHFSVPFRFTRRNLLDFAQHPRWALELLRQGMPVMENLIGLDTTASSSTAGSTAGGASSSTAGSTSSSKSGRTTGGTSGASAIASSVGKNYDAGFDWTALQKIRDQWPRKLIVKGVVHPDDALRLANMGCDAVVVSNHGGRQLDSGIASLDALPAVVASVAGKIPVLVDGGIRRGSDIVKALAAGASGVLVGRATLFGVMANGEQGAARALAILADELIRTMQLCGLRSVAEIGAGLLQTGPLQTASAD